MAVIFTTLAKKQVRAIRAHSERTFGRISADLYSGGMRETMESLSHNPDIGRVRSELGPGVRSFPNGSHIIIYRIVQTGIEILAVVHQRDDTGKYFT